MINFEYVITQLIIIWYSWYLFKKIKQTHSHFYAISQDSCLKSEDTEKDILMPHSKREIGFMKKHMAYDLILKFNEETVYDRKKFIKSSLKVQMDIKKDIFKVLSKMVIELMKNDMAHVRVLKFHKDTFSDCQKLIQSLL